MRFSTLAALAVAFASVAFAAEATTDAVETTAATQDVQKDFARWITNNATRTFLDLYLGGSCREGGIAINGWYANSTSLHINFR